MTTQQTATTLIKPEIDGLDLFLTNLGLQVLESRRAQRLSRRALSERAGVSQRTIVLLETGTGNISIVLLYKIAAALDIPLDMLFTSPSTRQKRICLLGLRGAGKSTLGRQLGRRLGLPFQELNQDIEALVGMSVTEIMSLYGPEGYRRLERQALEDVVASNHELVLEVAGGIVSNEQTYAYLLEHFHSIWLKALPEEHMQRVREQGDNRPMQGYPEAMTQLKELLIHRETLYAEAAARIDTSVGNEGQSLAELERTAQSLLSSS